ncbi:MAG: fumarylacetoacetate hydrolase family protein [Kordiimonadaceae bacterium]|jgi:fumarylacetoacetate (FAA) hydrolase|nr:fumarylacetoacetate hydrolase family protein [Kordiimonadaceae bacterium]MDB4218747.1 fumarylacetoacetate hydrolase family protein [Emcibacteraceae bacterium]MBT6135382.1 fumarylacetoacetate hydrolase family protein [Kordiimonadaceae bacterium]MBT7545720.1 fumarylacetoacetate hydrolase family protein [Kordiimonadaceae bacterium]MBT7604181.1 fumarylacetoacetate hydrolase family protein [Kordiimonadaceae bacterium]
MKLASLKHGRDGKLVVVSKDLSRYTSAEPIARTMQEALDNWSDSESDLIGVYEKLQSGSISGFDFDPTLCDAPLPRSYHWVDGSAYVTHVQLVRKARGAELPPSFWEDPLVYMGASDAFIGPHDDIRTGSEDWGIDLEAEVAVITDDVPAATTAEEAGKHIKLISILNDVSLRNLIPAELGKQFGFYQSKPWTAFAPVFVTPEELGDAWDGKKLHLPLHAILNGKKIGSPNAGIDMTFDFCKLIEHAAKTRDLDPGTVVGSGTVSNKGSKDGSCCLAEIRCLETIREGKPKTEFMKFGDRVEIDMFDKDGKTIFGRINQKVVKF